MRASESTTLDLRVERGEPTLVADFLTTPGALRSGHFELLSGLHSDRFLAFSVIAAVPSALGRIAEWLAPSIAPHQPTAVLSPSTAGVGLGFSLAGALGIPLHLASLDEAGRPDGLVGAPDLKDQRIALVNDVVTTGQGLEALKRVCADRGGLAVCAAWFLTRSAADVGTRVGLPTCAVCELDLASWEADGCELCGQGTEAEQALDLN